MAGSYASVVLQGIDGVEPMYAWPDYAADCYYVRYRGRLRRVVGRDLRIACEDGPEALTGLLERSEAW